MGCLGDATPITKFWIFVKCYEIKLMTVGDREYHYTRPIGSEDMFNLGGGNNPVNIIGKYYL